MIRLDRIELLHWDMQPHQVLPLARGVTLLTGENASGKTSILDAIKLALGASRLDGDRTVDHYLSKQAKPVVMVRVLADNRPVDGTRRRPFDRLGDISTDVVTLGVVFRAADDGEYSKDYLLVGGDVVPPLEPENRGFRFLAPNDYRARLAKVGITSRYLKLLALPQGRIADLCRREPVGLFDDLYDIIGGRHAFEEWQRRLDELVTKQKEHGLTRTDLDAARVRLEALGARSRRHQDWVRLCIRLAAHRAAIPHAEYRDAQGRVDQLTQRIHKLAGDYQVLVDREQAARRRGREAEELEASLAEEHKSGEIRLEQLNTQWQAIVHDEAENAARLKVLERIKSQASGITRQDTEQLEAQLEQRRVELAQTQALQESQAVQAEELDRDLATVRRGLLPLPPDVVRFQQSLRQEGIAHHLLHEVIEIAEPEWQHALEGVLGRLRFAIVLTEVEAWSRAAALARRERYTYGVLVPEVRGHSATDADSAFRLLRVHDESYRALVARILRSIFPGEHATPIVTTARNETVALDGFVVSKVEARFADPGHHVIGRLARERREREILEGIERLAASCNALRQQEGELRTTAKELKRKLEDQELLRAWEACREEHAGLSERRAELDGKKRAIEVAMRLEKERQTTLSGRRVSLGGDAKAADQEAKNAAREASARDVERTNAMADLLDAQEHLGTRLAKQQAPPTQEVNALLAEDQPLRTLQVIERELALQEAAYISDERDPMLPVNYQRQETEVAAVEMRLRLLGEALEETKNAAERAWRDYQQATRMVFRGYFARLAKDAAALDFHIEGALEGTDTGRFRCDLRVKVGDKLPVSYDSSDLSGGQKAALSILMAMTAVSLETDGAGFFLVDEPFSASDVIKMNELGEFLARSGAQYLVSMPTSADLGQCGPWLAATWTCTKTRGGFDDNGRPVLAPRVKIAFAPGARDG
jgi:chromosome segregation protein